MDAYVAKLNASGGALLYSTFLGGSGNDAGSGIVVDGRGNAYVAGGTTTPPLTTRRPWDASDTSHNGGIDAFLTEVDASGAALVYSTLTGSSGTEQTYALARSTDGRVVIGGATLSTAFPATPGAFDTTNAPGVTAGWVEVFDLALPVATTAGARSPRRRTM